MLKRLPENPNYCIDTETNELYQLVKRPWVPTEYGYAKVIPTDNTDKKFTIIRRDEICQSKI